MDLVLQGTVAPADRERDPYLALPFELPPGVTRIDLRYRHDPGSILDLGLLDPRIGVFPAREGFRGWSGGARSEVFVARDAATPGYLPGDLPPGRWQVLLGLARVAPEGCRYRVELAFDDAPRPPPPPAPAWPATGRGPGWYRGDLQSHSHHSDARGSLADLAAAARARGLDFVAVTDHNTCSHHPHLAALSGPELLLVPGQEVTTYRGHANVWGVDGWVDFRIRDAAQLGPLVTEVHARGGLISINHPKSFDDCIGCAWEWPVPQGADALEAWQGPWPLRNAEALARYDALLAAGRRLTLVGGSDRHQPGWPDPDPEVLQLGSPTTWLELDELSVPAVLDAVRAGRACVGDGPDGPRLTIAAGDTAMGGTLRHGAEAVEVRATMTGGDGLRLRWKGQGGFLREIAIDGDAAEDRWSWHPEGAFLRAELVVPPGDPTLAEVLVRLERSGKLPPSLDPEEILARPLVRALSNPVWLEPG